MKNRRIVITAIMLVAVLLMGVGYAAFTDTLNVQGTIDFKVNEDKMVEFDANVHFENFVAGETGISGVISPTEGQGAAPNQIMDTLILNVPTMDALDVAGEKVTVYVDVRNKTGNLYDVKVTLNDAESTGSLLGDLYKVTCVWKDTNDKEAEIAVSESKTVAITIELLRTPADPVTDDKFTITYHVDATTPSA